MHIVAYLEQNLHIHHKYMLNDIHPMSVTQCP